MVRPTLGFDATSLRLAYGDGVRLSLDAEWLRDAIGDGVAAGEAQRHFDPAGLPAPAEITRAVFADDETLLVTFAAEAGECRVPLAWLRRRLGASPGRAPRRLWDAGLQEALPWHELAAVRADAAACRAWLGAVAELGFALLSGVGREVDTVTEVACLFGHVRRTNYGQSFDVVSEAAPNNLANSALSLSLHTDNPYREPVPGLQLLHCLEASAEGGDTLLSDGFNAAERLRLEHPADFERLSRTDVAYRYVAPGVDLRARRPMIRCDGAGRVVAVAHNSRSRAPLDPSEDETAGFYTAYRRFVRLLHAEGALVRLRLAPGELVIMDNERVLHGRGAFAGGRRRLQGCYADKDALESRLRVLEDAA